MNLEYTLFTKESFVDLEPIIENIREGISFWGTRYVYIQGEKETFPIDILTKRISELMKQHNFEYSDAERTAGKKISAKIDQIYEDNNKRLEKIWCIITYVLCCIKDLKRTYKTPYYNWIFDHVRFDGYTDKQYEEKFHCKPDPKASFNIKDGVKLYFPPNPNSTNDIDKTDNIDPGVIIGIPIELSPHVGLTEEIELS